jgi:hypothetical protein
MELIKNALLFAGLMAVGGTVFVAVGVAVVRGLDLLENNYD